MKRAVSLLREISVIDEQETIHVNGQYLKMILRLAYLEGRLDVLQHPKLQEGNTELYPRFWGDIQNVEFEIEAIEHDVYK